MGSTDILVEHVVTAPVVNPKTRRRSRSFRFAGKVDRCNRSLLGGKVVDWKSSSDVSQTIKKLGLSFQPELYAIAEEASGFPVTAIEYRIVSKPTIKFCGKDVDRDAYEDRCLEWLKDDPSKLCTHSIILSRGALGQARSFLWHAAKRILENRQHSRWLPSSEACHNWHRACSFLSICECLKSGADAEWIIDQDYRVVDNPHPELGEQGKVFGLLTYSSLQMLTLCELRYWFLYERCLRKGREESEALWIGNAIHAGLEAYAKGGEQAALEAIDTWERQNPVLGEDSGRFVDQQIARARAMVRAAGERWPDVVVDRTGRNDEISTDSG